MHNLSSETKHLSRWFVAGGIVWSVLIAASLYWNYSNARQQSINLASIEVLTHFNKDTASRYWAASHGGVYVPIDEHTPPNPRLSHIPERDITTPSGKKLTLMNPAYMLRQMMQDFENLYGVKGKITTFPDKLFYQGNMPDAWELAALQRFQQGSKEVKEITEINGMPHMRLIRPLLIKQGCLKCHGFQGYKVGDLRGAVGVSVSMQPYLESEQSGLRALYFSHGLLWLVGLLALIYFFTRAKARAQELFDMEHQFRQSQKMEATGTLVGGIAHNFNNMLAGMTGNLYLAKKKSSNNPDVVEKLEKAEKVSFEAANMIKQLLTFARKGMVEIKPFGLTSFIKEILKLCESSIPDNIKFNQQLCREELVVAGDATQLQQVLLNLINNARDAVSGVSQPEISLTINEFEADDNFMITHPNIGGNLFAHLIIKDNGTGINDKDREHIFEPFYTTKEVGLGTGLGLPMVYGAIQSHGGVIEVDSRLGEGTAFHIYLPLLEEKNIDVTSDQVSKVVSGNGELILLVDDNAEVRSTVKDVLENLGYRVLEASNGLKAVDMFINGQQDISLIIMDVVMPILGGVQATERIRAISPEAKVIFATGYDKDETLKSEMPADESIVLSKPYDISVFSRAIRDKLDS
jgi:signal transduction histidine kinase/ActR/RegA family two-component response regulator